VPFPYVLPKGQSQIALSSPISSLNSTI
jgi:hypothetical protein